MILFEIENAGEFMSSLFVKEWLDSMELTEGEITTFCNIKIDGRRRQEWYDSQELSEYPETAQEFITWKEYKQQAYQMIKGKKVPQLFRLILRLPQNKLAEYMPQAVQKQFQPEDVQGLYLNIKYEKKRLSVVTGTSLKKFSMDKSLEQAWDEEIAVILKKQGFLWAAVT